MTFIQTFKKKKIFLILIPLYNDWESVFILIKKIQKLEINNVTIKIIIVNDCSKKLGFFKNLKKKKLIQNLYVLNLKKNFGHDRSIVIGMEYIKKKKFSFDYLITMDSDGEDNPKYLKKIVNLCSKDESKVVICKRAKRRENFLYKFLYFTHLIILFIFTFRWINHGGYNSISKNNLINLLNNKHIWGNYSGTLESLHLKKTYINTNKSKRYFGPSKTNFFKLIIHSFSIMSVFKKKIILSLFIYMLIVDFLLIDLNYSKYFFIFTLIFFYLLSTREKKNWKKIVFKNISSFKKIF